MFCFKILFIFFSILFVNCQNNNSAVVQSTSNEEVFTQNETVTLTTQPFKANDVNMITLQTSTIPTTTLTSVVEPSVTPKPVFVKTTTNSMALNKYDKVGDVTSTQAYSNSVNSSADLITTTTTASKYSNETADRRITLNMYFIKLFLPKTTKGMKIMHPIRIEFDDLNKKIVVNEWYNRFYGTSTRIPYRYKTSLNPFLEKFYNIYFKKLYL